MIYNIFQKNNFTQVEYKGNIISPYYKFDLVGRHQLKFRFVSCNSKFEQAIVIHYDSFDGEFLLNGKPIQKPESTFPQIVFREATAPREFILDVALRSGSFRICNGSDLLGDGALWRTLYGGCAMRIESKDNHHKFYCNDHENDDDFDDLIFEMEIKKID